jgi:hypothetical protein
MPAGPSYVLDAEGANYVEGVERQRVGRGMLQLDGRWTKQNSLRHLHEMCPQLPKDPPVL